jgi:hypothetical protein
VLGGGVGSGCLEGVLGGGVGRGVLTPRQTGNCSVTNLELVSKLLINHNFSQNSRL